MLKTFDWKLESELGHLTGSISRNKTLPEEGLESQGLDIVNRLGNVCLWVSSVIHRIWVTTLFIIAPSKMERAISCMEISLNSCDNLSEPGLSKVSAIEISSHMVDTINTSSDMFTYQKHLKYMLFQV